MTDSALPIIRPMTLAELLDRAIGLYRQNFLKFIGIFAIPYIPLMLIQSALTFFTSTSMINGINRDPANPFTPAMLNAYMGTLFFLFIQFILVNGVATAALTRAVANNYTGKPVGILDSYRTLSTSWLRLILALIVVFILVLFLFVWMIVPCVGWFSGPGILFFIGLVVTPLIAPIISLEKLGVFASIHRAWDLARTRFWWLVGMAFVLTLLGQLIVTGPVYLFSVILQFALSSFSGSMEQQLAISSISQTLITMSMSLLYVPLQLTVMTVVYFDLRARSEGLDLAMQMSGAAGSENESINLPEITNKSSMPFITGMDIGRFALLSLAGIAIYALIISVVFFIGMAAFGG
ncbi:MAG: hypothetical protein HZB50_00660 [Chloroflexi bacterium]|nr:hypothetical protein [Chloroflexota bacterium]